MEEMQQERVPIEGEMYHLTELFKTLGDPTRIRLMFILVKKEMSVSSLAKEMGVTESAVSHQLKMLRASRLVTSRREGKNIYYTSADRHAKELISIGREHIAESIRC